ncbi:MAG: tetratricopeptide repeat protein [Prolixibacteraceae bacterium]|nr:tetratricopeptide repeat protein [Prolixibacteraceae bacterium]
MNKYFIYRFLILSFLIVLISSCSTEKNTLINREFHNLNAHYNVYFNGNEALKAGVLKIEENVEEDYTKILPIFKESLSNTDKVVSGDMTTAIEKSEKLIKFHSITKPPVNKNKSRSRKKTEAKSEYNRWVDNAYMMMGKAYLYKKDFPMASSTFQLVIRKFKDEPVKYEAYLWLIRSYNESERYTESQQLIETLENDSNFPDKLNGELAIVAADMHLKQQHYDEAIRFLDIGIKNIKGNKRKTRYSFILAQLYQETGKKQQALTAYKQVVRRRPDYEMLFNARINSARVSTGDGNSSSLRKELNKMLKKKWNEPYYDQIYYALGNISYNDGKIDESIELYKKSVSFSADNIYQRALSCLTLADAYFEKRNYIPSGKYYDSAMVIIDDTYPNYESVSKKYNSLSKLVENLVTVETQDSLQKLALLSEQDLNKKIQGWIEAEKERQKALEPDEGEQNLSANYYRANSSRMRLSNTGSSFYFYNTSTVSYGKKEFANLWGERKNEDNWRRKDKSESVFNEEGEVVTEELAEEIAVEEQKRADDPLTPEYYTQDIPKNDSLLAASHIKIRDALFASGNISKAEFNDLKLSIGCYRGLNDRYSENIYELPSYFNLWDLYKSIGNTDSSAFYKNLIISKYPNTNYAKYLINPNFLVEEAARRDSINQIYTTAFNLYKKRDFNSAARYSNAVLKMNPDSSIESKAKFIQIVSSSRDLGNNVLSDSLQYFIKRYPKSEPVTLAQNILALIKNNKLTDYTQLVNSGYLSDVIKNNELMPQNYNTNDSIESKWSKDSDLLHYFVIAFPDNNDININRLKFDIANYNLDNFTSLDFEIETESLNPETRLLIVRNFDNKEDALIYFLSIVRKQEVFKTLAGKSYLNFVASNKNYREILNEKSYNDYLGFFIKNYSNITTGKFSEKDLESPEELMAKLKEDPADELKEQGEYVVVETKDANYTPPVKKEQLFNSDLNKPFYYTILIHQKNVSTGYLMRDFVKYNSSVHKDKRLKVIPNRLQESTLLSVLTFNDAFTANDYLKTTEEKNELFSSIKDLKYDSFIISEENFKKLTETGNIEEWKKFYETNFVKRRIQAPKAEVKSENKVSESTQNIEVPATVEKEKINTNKVPEKAELIKEIPSPNENEQEVKEVNIPEEKSKEITTSMYGTDNSSIQSLIFIVPTEGTHKTLLLTYISRFNAMKYRSFSIEVTTEKLDDINTMVIVKNIGNKEKAADYFVNLKADQRVSSLIKDNEYKGYLISNENLMMLRQSKDVGEYQKFHDANY